MRAVIAAMGFILAAISLAACTQVSKPRISADTSNASAEHVGPGTFAKLNALQREANALSSPLAVHEFYRRRYDASEGGLHSLIAQVLAANDAELGDYEAAVRRFPFGTPGLRLR